MRDKDCLGPSPEVWRALLCCSCPRSCCPSSQLQPLVLTAPQNPSRACWPQSSSRPWRSGSLIASRFPHGHFIQIVLTLVSKLSACRNVPLLWMWIRSRNWSGLETEGDVQSADVPLQTKWQTLLWRLKVRILFFGNTKLMMKIKLFFLCIKSQQIYVLHLSRGQCGQHQVLRDVPDSFSMRDPVWFPSLVSIWKSTNCHTGTDRLSQHQEFVCNLHFDTFRLLCLQGYPVLLPGKCWAFHGVQGTLVISLSHPIRITHVTLDHLPRYNAPTGRIDSAPKDFQVYVSDRTWAHFTKSLIVF